jgi:hypothetical protein
MHLWHQASRLEMASVRLGMDGNKWLPRREQTFFMNRHGDDFIIHGLFVDDMMHVPTCDRLLEGIRGQVYQGFLYHRGRSHGDIFQYAGRAVEVLKKAVCLHLDNYSKELLDEYKAYVFDRSTRLSNQD